MPGRSLVALAALLAMVSSVAPRASAEDRDAFIYAAGGLIGGGDSRPGIGGDVRLGVISRPFGLEMQSEYRYWGIDDTPAHTIFTSANILYFPRSLFEIDDDSQFAALDPYLLAGAGIGWGKGDGEGIQIDDTGVGRFWRFGGGMLFQLSDHTDFDFRVNYVLSPRGTIEDLDYVSFSLGFRYAFGE